MVTAILPPGGAQICHQVALLECKRCFFSAVCRPIWLILGWVVRLILGSDVSNGWETIVGMRGQAILRERSEHCFPARGVSPAEMLALHSGANASS